MSISSEEPSTEVAVFSYIEPEQQWDLQRLPTIRPAFHVAGLLGPTLASDNRWKFMPVRDRILDDRCSWLSRSKSPFEGSAKASLPWRGRPEQSN